jgi:MFS family permease
MVSLADMLNLIRCRNVVLCCIGGTGFIAWLLIHSVFAPLYMTQVAGLPATSAGLLMGASGAGSLIVGMSGSAWSDRVGRRSVVMTMALLCAILPLLLLMPPLYHPLWLLAALLAATQGGQALAALTLALIPAESVPRHQAAAAIGLVNLTSELLGGTVAPILAGRLSGEFGLKAPLLLASAGALLTFFSALFLREKQADR